MSAAQHRVRSRTASNVSGLSSRGRLAEAKQDFPPMEQEAPPRYMEPCAATASMFLYAQGNSIVCAHHDTLTIERRFSSHQEEVQILAVDNLSDVGKGRLVVSYDASQTAIVWDLMTGEEVARFVSYEHLTCAAWMKSGIVAFGNAQGSVILFEPTTSEHLSARTLDQIAVTAIAPSADCRTFAIGYQNGSLLIATIQPRFTILQNLTTSRGPSPIVNLAWHASSARQKSDMLAVQTNDGDLRVWSVAKASTNEDPAKIVRILKRTENYLAGPNWMGWSKNGRIIQFSESETVSWDVRTKHVTYDTIPTPDTIRGLAVFGPGASLFTLGANSTVQQYDLNAPAQMVANVQHPANLLPPSPPISLEEQKEGGSASANNSESESMPIQITADMSESEPEHTSPLARLVRAGREPEPARDHYRATSPESQRSRSDVSLSSTSSRTPGHRNYPESVVSRGMTENTFISTGSSIRSSAQPQYRDRRDTRDSFSTTSSMSSVSMTSSHRPRHRPSRLRHEVPRSPEDSKSQDLFKFTRSRLTDVPYRQPYMADNSRLTNDDLRRQMLSTIFGWNREIDELIRDEISRHPAGSTSRVLLSKWLGDVTEDVMPPTSEMTSADWMKLALLGMSGNSAQQSKIGRAYIPKLLETGDLHTAVTMLIGYGDHNDAIEIYVSHKKYLEALILTCLFFPSVWPRQEQIIKKWGEWLIHRGEQQLAIRCFACTGKESSEQWTSPSAAQITFPNIGASIPELLSPPLSPPTMTRGPQRSLAMSSSLKLITSFGGKSKYFAGGDTATPIAAGPTPIAESAMRTPGGYEDPTTAVLRPSVHSSLNTPASAIPRSGFNQARLPSIGEQPNDSRPRDLMTGEDASEEDDGGSLSSLNIPDFNRSKTASPQMMRRETKKDMLMKRDPPPPSPSPQSLAALMSHNNKRNGSRTRIPGGLDLHLQSYNQQQGHDDITSPEPSAASSAASRYHWPSRRRGPASVASSVTSAASSVARSHRGRERSHQHNTSGKTLDDYINNLDVANNQRARQSSRGRERDSSRQQAQASRDVSQTRGRASSRGIYTPKGPKRSPTSPVPMSPEDLITLATPNETSDNQYSSGRLLIDIPREEQDPPSTVKKVTRPAQRESSKSRTRDSSRVRSRSGRDRSTSRRPPALDLRGRSNIRDGSVRRSPTSPVPMSAGAADFYGSGSDDDYKKAVEAKEKFRSKRLTGRSRSRNPNDPSSPVVSRSRNMSFSTRDPMSPAVSVSTRGGREFDNASVQSRPRDRSESRAGDYRRRMDMPMPTPQPMQLEHLGGDSDFKSFKTERQLKKEQAARELEERRRSLATRALNPPIVHPNDLSPLPSSTFVPPRDLPTRSQTTSPGASRSMHANRGPHIGLPATPKAMRLVLDSEHKNVPVPPIPASFAQAASPKSNHPSPARVSPKKASPELPSLAPITLLPSTVYTPPPPRSASAPPVEPMVPDILRSGSAMNNRGLQRPRKSSVGEGNGGRRPSYDSGNSNKIPPPPPPAPSAMLKELQHLAMPPPPPPAPMYAGNKPVVYGGSSGMIEIVMDDDETAPPPPPSVPVAAPVSDAHVPIIAPPAPPSSRNGHHRGRSSVDNSIAGRISRATERMRSASRSRTNTPGLNRTKSPETTSAPYESIPPPPQLSFQARSQMSPPPAQGEFRTGLHQSEMI